MRAAANIMSDSAEADEMVGRIGGDEFALWLSADSAAEAEGRAKRLTEQAGALAEFSKDLQATLGMAAGIALFEPDSNEEIDDLFARADQAMYAAKRDPERNFTLVPPAEKAPPAQMATP